MQQITVLQQVTVKVINRKQNKRLIQYKYKFTYVTGTMRILNISNNKVRSCCSLICGGL